MTTENTHQNPLGSRSLAESSIAFVILSAGILIVIAAISAIIWFIFLDKGSAPASQRYAFFAVVFGLWTAASLMLWRSTLARMRCGPDIDLSENGFFVFQVAASVFVFAVWVLLRFIPNDVPSLTTAMRVVFEVLLLLFNGTYLSFAWGVRKAIPVKTYVGLLLNVAVVSVARLG